jgi:hypothetical protein
LVKFFYRDNFARSVHFNKFIVPLSFSLSSTARGGGTPKKVIEIKQLILGEAALPSASSGRASKRLEETRSTLQQVQDALRKLA